MKLNLFKNISTKPLPIAAMASNNSTIVLFRRGGPIELMDSYGLRPYFATEFGYRAVSCRFIDQHTVVCGTECEKLVFFNIKTFSTVAVDVEGIPSAIGTRPHGADVKQRPLYYSVAGNVYERGEHDSELVYRGGSVVTSLLLCGDGSLIAADGEGKVRVLRGGKVVSELQVSPAKVNMVCHVTGDTYVSACDDGSFSYFDVDVGVVLQTSRVRDTPLNVCVYVGDKLHLSGADSRIVAFSRSGRKFIRSYQVDTHYAEVRGIEVDNGRILTCGDDTILSVVWPAADRYLENKIFHKAVEVGASKTDRTFYINNRTSIDLYSFDLGGDAADSGGRDENAEAPNCTKPQEDEEITFKLSKSSAERMGYVKQDYRYRMRISTEGSALCSSAPPDLSYVVYSNPRETRVVTLGGSIKARGIHGGANRLIAGQDLIVLQNYRHEILLIDVHTDKVLRKIPFDDYREEIYLVGDLLILGHSKTVYSIQDAGVLSRLSVDGEVVGVCEHTEGHFVVFTMARSLEAKKRYLVYRVSVRTHEAEVVKALESYALITSVSSFEDTVIFTNFNAVQMLGAGMEEEKYPLGAVIYGSEGMKGEVVVVQDSWSSIRLGLPPSVFKEKFSNK